MTDQLPDWRSRCRRPALLLALASVVFPMASFGFAILPISWEEYTRWSVAVGLFLPLGVVCGLLAIPFGLIAKKRIATLAGLLFGGLPFSLLLVPSPPRRRPAAPESTAVSNLRTLNTAEITYFMSVKGTYGDIPQLISSGLIDSRFANPSSGYNYDVTTSESGYTATAMPTSKNEGRYGYFTLSDAVIRYATSATVTCVPCFPEGQSGSPVQ